MGTFFLFSRKKGHIIFNFQRVRFFHATLMLMHETPKIGPEHTVSRTQNYAVSNFWPSDNFIPREQCFDGPI